MTTSGTDSKSRLSALDAVLEAEADLFEELTQLVREQRVALLSADLDELNQLNARAETLAARFELLESERVRAEERATEPLSESTRERATAALESLLKEASVSGTILTRQGDTIAARRAAVASLFGTSYLADGRTAGLRATGVALSKEV